jgi:hypothetical protein
VDELEAAIAPLLWGGVAAGVALAAIAAAVLVRGTQRVAVPHERAATRDRIVVALLTLLGAAARLPAMTRPLGTDEAGTFLYYASKPLAIVLTIYGSPNNHLLHTILAHVAVRMFGDAEWGLRLPAFLAGTALIPLAWWTARRLGCNGALIAAGLVAGAPALVDYSNDARGYTLLCACTLVAAAAMAGVVRHGARRAAIVFAAAAALGFYTVPVMLYPFVFIAVAALVKRGARRAPLLAALAAALLLTAALYAPVIAVSGVKAIIANHFVRPIPPSEFFAALPHVIVSGWTRSMAGIPLVVQLLIVIGVVAGRRLTLATGAGALAVAAVVLVQRVLPFPRLWLPFLPLLFIAAACGWRWPRFEALVAVAAAVALGLAAAATVRPRETGELPNVLTIARTLRMRVRPGDQIVAGVASDLPLAFYLRGVPIDVLHPDVAHARRIFVVTNRTSDMTLPRTLELVHIDARAFTVRRVDDYGASALYVLTR